MSSDDRRPSAATDVEEDVVVRGHIIDSLLLPKILDRILLMGGSFEIKECKIGPRRVDPSFARISVRAKSVGELDAILGDLVEHGATPVHPEDVRVVVADRDGCFPDEFYATTNQRTEVRIAGRWTEVAHQEMDCGIVIDPVAGTASCLPITDVVAGQLIVVGHDGIKVEPLQRARRKEIFAFMNSAVSTERPKDLIISQLAEEMRDIRARGKNIIVVGGPAIIHTGAGPCLSRVSSPGATSRSFLPVTLWRPMMSNPLSMGPL